MIVMLMISKDRAPVEHEISAMLEKLKITTVSHTDLGRGRVELKCPNVTRDQVDRAQAECDEKWIIREKEL